MTHLPRHIVLLVMCLLSSLNDVQAFQIHAKTVNRRYRTILANQRELGDPIDNDVDRQNKTPSSHFFSRKSLSDFPFSSDPIFANLCQAAGIEQPSKIQSLAWPILGKATQQPTILADQTGSGKTLAYLVPLLYKMILQEQHEKQQKQDQQQSTKRPNGSPRLLILAPTAELADQIRAVCVKLSTTGVKFATVVLSAHGQYATSIRDQIRLLQRQRIDVLISTPGRIATIARTRNSGLDLGQLQALVLDEVDILLMDETFGPQLRTIGAETPLSTQFVFVTATLPDSIIQTVQQEFPNVVQIKGPGLHRVAPTITERLIDVSVPVKYHRDNSYCFDVKAQELLKSLRQTKCRRTLIFCNTVETCRAVENLLHRQDRRGHVYNVLPYHNALTPETRTANLALFSKGYAESGDDRGRRDDTSNNDLTDFVLVCTDRAARGVDFDASPVDHVVLFDFPKDPAEYVRRVGRTARAGRSGTTTVLAYGWQLPIAKSVMGKKLESYAAAVPGKDDKDDEDDFVTGALEQKRKRRRRKGVSDTDAIRERIAQSKTWRDRKSE